MINTQAKYHPDVYIYIYGSALVTRLRVKVQDPVVGVPSHTPVLAGPKPAFVNPI